MCGLIVWGTNSFRRALGEALVEAGLKSRDVVVLDADTPGSTGSILFARRFPDRFFNVGISEQDLVSTAAGLAVGGKVPVVTGFAMFLMRAWEQVRNVVSRDGLNVKIVATHAGLSDHMDGASHQCFEDVALMRVLPGFTVAAPADVVAARDIVLRAVLEHRGPVYVRLGRENSPGIYESGEEFPLGGARVLVEGGDVTVFSYGPMLGVARGLVGVLRSRGVDAGLVDVYTLKPVDRGVVAREAGRSGRAVTLEDHSVYGGLGSVVAEVLAEVGGGRLLRLGVDGFGSSSRSYEALLEFMGFTPERLASRVLGWL